MLKLAYFIEITWLLVDTASGYFQNNGILFPGNQTLGSIFRIFVFLLFALIIIKHPKGSRMVPILLFPLLIILAIVRAIYWNFEFVQVLNDVQFQVKILFAILLFSVFEIQLMKGELTASKINKIVIVNSGVLLTNIYLGLFGIGFGSYGETEGGEMLGSKGFLYAGNEVSITLVALFALLIFLYGNLLKTHITRSIIVLALFFFASISLLSKTSMIGFVLVTLFAIYNYLTFKNRVTLAVFFALFLALTSALWFPILNVAIERWQYFYEIVPDPWAFITSGRSERAVDFYSWINDYDEAFSVFIGQGHLGDASKFSFENDLLDLIMKAGLSGLFIYFSWFAWVGNGIKDYLLLRRVESKFTVYMLLMILVISIFAGHVIYSAMLAPFVALIAVASSPYFHHEKTNYET
jgi:hypothetical protein